MAEHNLGIYRLAPSVVNYIIALFVGLILLEFAYIAIFISDVHMAGPVQDVWGLIPYLEKNLDRGWFNEDLWHSQNGHRLVLLKLQFLIDYFFFDGKNVFISSSIFICVAAQIITLCLLTKRNALHKKIIAIPVFILLSPTVLWSILHNFNIHMLQCAVFSFIGILIFAYGIEMQSKIIAFFGIIFAILSSLSAFSITSIWPTLFFITMLSPVSRSIKIQTLFLFGAFIAIYVFCMPDLSNDQGASEFVIIAFESLQEGRSISVSMIRDFIVFIATFLSYSPWPTFLHVTFALLSLVWFCILLFRIKDADWLEKVSAGLMLYAIFFALTVGVARGYLGELAYGIRFQPVALVYWVGFSLSILIASFKSSSHFIRVTVLVTLLAYFSVSQVFVTQKLEKQLTEDYIRFSRSQMAYLSGNLEENGVYENLVKEWRQVSYPGIVTGSRFLKERKLGIFSESIGEYLASSSGVPGPLSPACLGVKLVQRPRSNDPLIQNVFIDKISQTTSLAFSHILIYKNDNLIGVSFRQPLAPFSKERKTRWLGVTRYPVDPSVDTLLAFHKNTVCFVTVSKF